MNRTGTALICAAFCLLLAVPAAAGVNVNIGIGVPIAAPVVVVPAAPSMVVVPGTPVYYAPGLNVDVFFYGGFWWTPHNGYWFRANTYDGPWAVVHQPPPTIVRMPHNYRQLVVREKPMPYGQWKKMHAREFREEHHEGRPGGGGRDWDDRGGGNRDRGGGHDKPGKGHGKHKHGD